MKYWYVAFGNTCLAFPGRTIEAARARAQRYLDVLAVVTTPHVTNDLTRKA